MNCLLIFRGHCRSCCCCCCCVFAWCCSTIMTCADDCVGKSNARLFVKLLENRLNYTLCSKQSTTREKLPIHWHEMEMGSLNPAYSPARRHTKKRKSIDWSISQSGNKNMSWKILTDLKVPIHYQTILPNVDGENIKSTSTHTHTQPRNAFVNVVHPPLNLAFICMCACVRSRNAPILIDFCPSGRGKKSRASFECGH